MTHNNVLLKFTVNIVLVALNKCILFMSPRHTSFIDIYMYFSDKIQVYFLFFWRSVIKPKPKPWDSPSRIDWLQEREREREVVAKLVKWPILFYFTRMQQGRCECKDINHRQEKVECWPHPNKSTPRPQKQRRWAMTVIMLSSIAYFQNIQQAGLWLILLHSITLPKSINTILYSQKWENVILKIISC